MTRTEIIARIKAHAGAIHALGAASLYLYGSAARDAVGPDSDIDLFFDRDTGRHFGFVELTELEFLLGDLLGRDVDISTRTGLHPELSAVIEQSAMRIL